MSAVQARSAPQTVQPARVHALAVWRVLPGALLVLGHAGAPVPAAGVVQAGGAPSSRGVFRALSWPSAEGGQGVLLAVRLPGRADPADGGVLFLRGAAGEALVLDLPASPLDDVAFGQQAARLAGAHAPAAARFLLDALRPPPVDGPADAAPVSRMMRAFLSLAAQPDGHIEIMAALPGACVMLQGWGARLTGPLQVVLAGALLPSFPAQAGEFARPDIAVPAVGVMLALPPAAADALGSVDHLFILSEAGLHSRSLVEHRVLDAASGLGHLRHMMPGLRCPPAMEALLLDALRPRWDGRDTLAGNAHPVRAAVDTSVGGPGIGVYLSGWVFDPAGIIAGLHLCGPGGAARMDGAWTRVPRSDVSEAFRDTPGFPALRNGDAGFAVFLPDAPNGPLHLQVTFTDGDRAFMPIPLADACDAAVRARLLAGVDLFKPSGADIIERHAAPLMARVRPAPAPAPVILVRGPVGRAEAVVVPLAAPVLPRAFLSSFMHDPLKASEQLVLACGPDWHPAALEALRGLVRFLALPTTVLMTTEAGAAAALRAAALVTTAERFLLAGPGVSPRAPGWRAALRMALARSGPAFACPTLLYEDWSIRYAGASRLEFADTPPYAHVRAALAGLPAAMAVAEAPQWADAGTLECCLLRRASLTALDGAGALSTGPAQEAAFFRRLQAAGMAGLWVPTVQVYAPEEAEASGRVAALVDGWVLRDAWHIKEGE